MTEFNFNYIPLEMTREEFVNTDFYKLAEGSIKEMVEREGYSSLSRNYRIAIINETEGNGNPIKEVKVSIDLETFLIANKDYRETPQLGGYVSKNLLIKK